MVTIFNQLNIFELKKQLIHTPYIPFFFRNLYVNFYYSKLPIKTSNIPNGKFQVFQRFNFLSISINLTFDFNIFIAD